MAEDNGPVIRKTAMADIEGFGSVEYGFYEDEDGDRYVSIGGEPGAMGGLTLVVACSLARGRAFTAITIGPEGNDEVLLSSINQVPAVAESLLGLYEIINYTLRRWGMPTVEVEAWAWLLKQEEVGVGEDPT